MKLNYLHEIHLPCGRAVGIREMSFLEYKAICKYLFNQTDPKKLNSVFSDIISAYVKSNRKKFNIYDKTILLLHIRGLTLGKNIVFSDEATTITINTDELIENFKFDLKPFEYKTGNYILTLGLPYSYNFSPDEITARVFESISTVSYKGSTWDVVDFEDEEKQQLCQEIAGAAYTDIFRSIIKNYSELVLQLPVLTDVKLNLFDTSFLQFIRSIFDENISSVIDLEYTLRKNLNFNSHDLETVSYPECKILLNKLAAELKEKEDKGGINLPG